MSGRRLDAVLRVRRLQEQIARGEVAARRRDEHDRQRRRHELATEIDEIDVASATDASSLTARRATVEAGIRAFVQAGIDVGTARQHVVESLDAWQVAAQRQEGVERLDEKLTAAARADEQRRRSNEIDDLVVTAWGRSSR